MMVKVKRHTLWILPETPQDAVYVEQVLGLRNAGDSVRLVRPHPKSTCLRTETDQQHDGFEVIDSLERDETQMEEW